MPKIQSANRNISRFGPFEILEKIGSGRTSDVYKVRRDGSVGVLKSIKPHLKFDAEAVSAIRQESRILSAIEDRRHFPTLYEAGEIEESHYLFMEHVDGLNLKEATHRAFHYREPLSAEDSCFVAAEICEGLEYLHGLRDQDGRPILHRDIKSSNVVLGTDGAVKLIDLSLKHGTFNYTPLEQLEKRNAGPYTDIFGTGNLLYETIHGRPLIKSHSQLNGYFEMKGLRIDESSFDSSIPPALRRILSRSLGQDSPSRYGTIDEFKDELWDFLGKESRTPRSLELGEKVSRLKGLPRLKPILPIGRLQKVDPQGYFLNDASPAKVRPPWDEAVEATKAAYLRHIPESVHSIYLRGSLPVGRAIARISDIDTLAVTKGALEGLDLRWVGQAKTDLKKRFPFCAYAEFDFVPLDRLLVEPGYFSRRFVIKTQSICIHGEDLAPRIPKFKPSLEIAYYFHGNIGQVLRDAAQDISRGDDPERIKLVCRGVMKRLLRTGFELTIERSKVFTRDLYPCYDIFSKFYPKQEAQMWQALEWSINPIDDKARLLDYLNTFGAWLAGETARKLAPLNLSP